MAEFSFTESGRDSAVQLLRYAMVGLAINVSGYLVYLLITYFGLTPKITVTMLYFVGALAGFWGNRKLTFMHQGSVFGAGARYAAAHGLGYLINLAILILFVDSLGYPHQWVQAVAVFVVAGYLFLAFKFFVFSSLKKPGVDVS